MTGGPFGVIGGGAWGTALAQILASDGSEVRLWAREPEVIDSINDGQENALFLPGIALSPLIRGTSDLTWVAEAGPILIVTPAQHMRAVLRNLNQHAQTLILCSKGIEADSHRL